MKVRTSVLRGFALLALSSLTFAACDERAAVAPPPVIAVTVTPPSVSLLVGQPVTLIATVSGTTNQAVTWASTNTAVATVTAAGVVTAVAPGTAVITATSAADPTARSGAAVVVTAVPPPPPPTLSLIPATATVVAGSTLQLVAIVGNTTIMGVTYASSDTAIATVSAAGLVTARRAGTAVITGRTVATPVATATSTVTVTAAPPPPTPHITIAPTTASVQVGRTQTFVATVTGVANTAVLWRTSDAAVATVTAAGVATGVSAGTAVITAISVADTTRRVDATLTVTAAPPVTQPAISIQSVNTVANPPAAVTPGGAAVGGNIRVTMNVSAGSEAHVTAVRVLLGNQVACTQSFNPPLTATQGVQAIDCTINLAAVDGNNMPVFPNGAYQLTAEAITTTGTNATANWGTLNVFNASTLSLSITTNAVSSANNATPGSAVNPNTGIVWREGDVVVTARGVMYAGGSLDRVTVCLTNISAQPLGAPCRTATTQSSSATASFADGLFTVVFPKSATVANHGVSGVEDAGVSATVTSVTTAGVAGPTDSTATINLDNRAPTVTTFGVPHQMYVNDNRNFAAAANLATTDAGVDAQVQSIDIVSTASLVAGSPAVVAGGQGVTTTAGVPETATNAQYVARVTTTDLLGNARTMYAHATNPATPQTAAAAITTPADIAQFGVDRTAPTYQPTPVSGWVTTVAGTTSTGAAPTVHNVQYQDQSTDPGAAPSGFSGTPVRARLIQYTPSALSGRCIDPRDGVTVVSTTVNTRDNTAVAPPPNAPVDANAAATGCYFWITQSVQLPASGAATAGYYVMDAVVYDAAGNASGPVTRTRLIDGIAPNAGNINVPTSITGNQTATFSALLTDNVELGSNTTSIGYTGLGMWLLQGSTSLATFGPDPLTFSLVHQQTVDQFIRSITPVDAVTGLVVMAGQDDADQIAFQVRDMVGSRLSSACPALNAADNTTLNNCRLRVENINAAVLVGSNNGQYLDWTTVLNVGSEFRMPGAAVTRCNGDDAGGTQTNPCPTNLSSAVALSATLTGPAQTFVNPFQRVEFWVRAQGAGPEVPWTRLGTATTTMVTDNQQTGIRTWTYSAVSFDPAGRAAGAYDVIALGVTSNGDALRSVTRATITVAVD